MSMANCSYNGSTTISYTKLKHPFTPKTLATTRNSLPTQADRAVEIFAQGVKGHEC
jgi:hypothetical protein